MDRRKAHSRLLLLIALALLARAGPAGAQAGRRVTRLAEGVYAIEHGDEGEYAGGNTTVVIGDKSVLVVDAPFLPADARQDIADIRRWTNKPVAYLVNTHFHNDHNLTNRVYADSFPGVVIVAQEETKRDMDRFGPGSVAREERRTAMYRGLLDPGATNGGKPLTDSDKTEVKAILVKRAAVTEELKRLPFQSATLTFDHQMSVDLGQRVARVLFLGRGNTAGDAVVFLPAERVVAAGDLVVHPMPYFYDGYPSEWVHTLDNLMALDPVAIVPGHGPVMKDLAYASLTRQLIAAAVDQVNAALVATGPALSRTVDDVRGRVDLSAFRTRFAGNDAALGAAFDREAQRLVGLVFREASLR